MTIINEFVFQLYDGSSSAFEACTLGPSSNGISRNGSNFIAPKGVEYGRSSHV